MISSDGLLKRNREGTHSSAGLHLAPLHGMVQLHTQQWYGLSWAFLQGLDSYAALNVMAHMNALAAMGQTIILSVHQPRAAIFEALHKVRYLYPALAFETCGLACSRTCTAHHRTALRVHPVPGQPADSRHMAWVGP